MNRPRVLVLDDHDGTLELIARALRKDCAVWVARDVAQATAVAEELDWDADLLVVDLFLAEGERGDDFAAQYRTRQRKDTPVIVVSGALDGAELHPDAAVAAVVHKPFEVQALRTLVHMVTGSASAPRLSTRS